MFNIVSQLVDRVLLGSLDKETWRNEKKNIENRSFRIQKKSILHARTVLINLWGGRLFHPFNIRIRYSQHNEKPPKVEENFTSSLQALTKAKGRLKGQIISSRFYKIERILYTFKRKGKLDGRKIRRYSIFTFAELESILIINVAMTFNFIAKQRNRNFWLRRPTN